MSEFHLRDVPECPQRKVLSDLALFGDSFAPKLVKSTHTFPTRSHHVPAISPQVHRIWSLTRPCVTTGNIKNVWWVHGKAKVGIWSWSLKCEVNISGCLSPHTLIWQGQGWYEYAFFKSSDTLGLNFDGTVLYFAKQSVYVLPKRRVYCSEVAFPSHRGLICVFASNTSPQTLKSNGSLLESLLKVPKKCWWLMLHSLVLSNQMLSKMRMSLPPIPTASD